MVMGIDLELCVFERVDTTRFYPIYFIFQGSKENHSKTLNNLRNIFPAAAFENQLSSIIHRYIFYFAISFNQENCLLINWHTPSKYLQILATCTDYLNI